jgi:hypothetical protein
MGYDFDTALPSLHAQPRGHQVDSSVRASRFTSPRHSVNDENGKV